MEQIRHTETELPNCSEMKHYLVDPRSRIFWRYQRPRRPEQSRHDEPELELDGPRMDLRVTLGAVGMVKMLNRERNYRDNVPLLEELRQTETLREVAWIGLGFHPVHRVFLRVARKLPATREQQLRAERIFEFWQPADEPDPAGDPLILTGDFQVEWFSHNPRLRMDEHYKLSVKPTNSQKLFAPQIVTVDYYKMDYHEWQIAYEPGSFGEIKRNGFVVASKTWYC